MSTKIKKSCYFIKWLLYPTFTIILLISLLILVVFLIQQVVSTDWFRIFVEKKVSQTIQRPIHIKKINWSWTDGINLESVSIEDDPAFSTAPILSIDKVKIIVKLKDLIHQRIVFGFRFNGLKSQIIKNHDGKTNLYHLLSQVKEPYPVKKLPPKEAPIDWLKTSFSIPLDIQGQIYMGKMSFRFEDKKQDSLLTLCNMSLSINTPSLTHEPITMNLSAVASINDKEDIPVNMNANLEKLFNSEGAFTLSDALISINVSLPAINLEIKGNLSERRVKSNVTIDLERLMKVVQPYMPRSFPTINANGKVDILMNISGDPKQILMFDSTLTGYNLDISGWHMKGKKFGHFKFKLLNSGMLNVNEGNIIIQKGEIHLLDRTWITWNGIVEELKSKTPVFAFNIGPVSLDLLELNKLSKDYIPKEVSLVPDRISSQNPATLKIEDIELTGKLPDGPNHIKLKNLALSIPAIKFNMDETSLSAQNSTIIIKNLKLLLKEFFPEKIEMKASLESANVSLKGINNIYLKQLKVPLLDISTDEIHISNKALFGLTTKIKIKDSLFLDSFKVSNFAMVKSLKKNLVAELYLPPEPLISAKIKELSLFSPALFIENKHFKSYESDISMDNTINHIVINSLNPLKADIKGMKSTLAIGKFLVAELAMNAKNLAFDNIDSKGVVELNMSQLLKQLPMEMFHNAKLEGKAKLRWDLTARLPTSNEIEQLKEAIKTPSGIKSSLEFLKRLEASVSLEDIAVDWPSANGHRLKAKKISTNKPLKITIDKGIKKGTIDGGLVIGGIVEMPFLETLNEPLKVTLELSGKQEMMKSLTISEALNIESLDMKQTLHISLYDIDRLMRHGLDTPLPLWLTLIGGKIYGSLDIGEISRLNFIRNDFYLNGQLKLGASLNLNQGQKITLKGWMYSPGMHAQLNKSFKIKKLQSHLNLTKLYRIKHKTREKASSEDISLSLSHSMLQPISGFTYPFEAENRIASKLRKDITAHPGAPNTISFETAHTELAPLSLKFTNYMMNFYLKNGLPRLDYFKSDLLGGTVTGSLSLMRKEKGMYLNIGCIFSGINSKKLMFEPIYNTSDEDAEINGQLSLSMPLSTKIEPLLEELLFKMELTHIGPQALEHILYALDPYESNEAIVNQRKQLLKGIPRWFQIAIKHGNLSMYGEVDVKGIRLKIPPIERLNLTNIWGLKRYEKELITLAPTIKALHLISSNTIEVDDNGKIRLLYIK